MIRYSVLLILLGTTLPSFSQLGVSHGPALRVFILNDSLTGEKIEINGPISSETSGRLLVEADPNDVRKEIYDRQLMIEVIHARNSSALARIRLNGLMDFAKNDVLKTLRPTLNTGDRIVLTFKMMADAEPSAFMILVQ